MWAGLRKRGQKFPTSSLVFTGTAQSGSLALAENFLYTAEAFDLYLNRLRSGGMLAIFDDSPHRTLRQAATALAALERRGLSPAKALSRVAVIEDPSGQTGYRYLLMAVPAGPVDGLWASVRAQSARRDLKPLWLAGAPAPEPYASLAALGLERFHRASPLNFEPPTDDAPFFFDFSKGLGRLRPLWPLLGLAAFAVGAAALFARRSLPSAADRRPAYLAGLLGGAFMLVESALLAKLTLAAGTPAAILSLLLFSLLFWCALGGACWKKLAGSPPRLRPALAAAGAAAALAALILRETYLLAGLAGTGPRYAAVFALLAPLFILA